MKSLIAALALSTALVMPGLVQARTLTVATQMASYGGPGAYVAFYVTDAQGAYAGSLWMSGGKGKYYKHLSDWYAATGGDRSQVDGITGASIGSGGSLEISFELQDALFDAGYTLHLDAAVEEQRDSPNEVAIPLSSDQSGQPVQGRRYIDSVTVSF